MVPVVPEGVLDGTFASTLHYGYEQYSSDWTVRRSCASASVHRPRCWRSKKSRVAETAIWRPDCRCRSRARSTRRRGMVVPQSSLRTVVLTWRWVQDPPHGPQPADHKPPPAGPAPTRLRLHALRNRPPPLRACLPGLRVALGRPAARPRPMVAIYARLATTLLPPRPPLRRPLALHIHPRRPAPSISPADRLPRHPPPARPPPLPAPEARPRTPPRPVPDRPRRPARHLPQPTGRSLLRAHAQVCESAALDARQLRVVFLHGRILGRPVDPRGATQSAGGILAG